MILLFLYKQKTAYEMRISDWSSDVCSSDLVAGVAATLPDVGILLGVLPTVALTAGLHSGRAAVAILAAAMVLQALEALHIRHWVDRWGVAVGPPAVWMVVLLASTLHGLGMAFFRSDERRGGKEWVSVCCARLLACPTKKQKPQ